MLLLDTGDAAEALRLSEQLISSSDKNDQISGYVCRGFAYEDGGVNLDVDLSKAVNSYRHAAILAPDSITFSHMARASMKIGDGAIAHALRFLLEAKELRYTPVVDLGFAEYYRIEEVRNFELAKRHYIRAAFHGRFAGFFGYSELSREAGQRYRAFVVDCLRVLLGPFIAILIGSAAQERF